MYSFNNDYSEGACPEIMDKMLESNRTQSVGYGLDDTCEQAKIAIKKHLKTETCDIHFLVGGTQANLTVIASMLRPFEAVIAVDSGHINVHETGSIEATGHKVVIASGSNGKISVAGIQDVVMQHSDEHMVKPKMVYISNATELGTIYTLQELKDIHDVCEELNLYLFLDGARLPMALCAKDNDMSLVDIASLCDVFYLGGTKCGALFGEAVVILNDYLKPDFRYMIKQRGGMLAKGRLLGIQFLTLFEQDLYFSYAKHANEMAQRMQDAMKKVGIKFVVESQTNQIFPILSNEVIQKLKQSYLFQEWGKVDEHHTAMRFVTSWATPNEAVTQFIADFNNIIQK